MARAALPIPCNTTRLQNTLPWAAIHGTCEVAKAPLEHFALIGRLTYIVRTLRVKVRFPRGLHPRPAATLVAVLKRFRSRVVFQVGNRVANAGSLLSILLLAATLNTELDVRATGEDEEAAIRAAEIFFQNDDEDAARFPIATDSSNPSATQS